MTGPTTNRLYGSVPPGAQLQAADRDSGIRDNPLSIMQSNANSKARDSAFHFFEAHRREKMRRERCRASRLVSLIDSAKRQASSLRLRPAMKVRSGPAFSR